MIIEWIYQENLSLINTHALSKTALKCITQLLISLKRNIDINKGYFNTHFCHWIEQLDRLLRRKLTFQARNWNICT